MSSAPGDGSIQTDARIRMDVSGIRHRAKPSSEMERSGIELGTAEYKDKLMKGLVP